MGITRGPNIVTDGLVFAVDAANPSSYPGSGTTWKDQTVNQNDGTLINGPTFDSGNGGSIVFDGVDDYIDFGNNNIFSFGNGSTDSPFSISSWINMNNATRFRIANKYNISGNKEYIFNTGGSDQLGLNLYDSSAGAYIGRKYNTALTSYEGQWIQVVCTYNGSSNSSGIKLYLNGIKVDDTNNNSGTYTAMENSTFSFLVGKQGNDYGSGNISNTQIYNKALSASEILHNYNALKGRFGL